MSTIKEYFLSLKSIVVILLIVLTIFLTALFSRQLQSKTPISYQTKAFDFTPHSPGTININIPTIPPINTNINIKRPLIIIPTLSALPVINIQPINLPLLSNPVPLNNVMIGSVVSQGSAIIQQILTSPNAKQIIAMFLAQILSPQNTTPISPSTTPRSPTLAPPTSSPQQQSPTPRSPQAQPTSSPTQSISPTTVIGGACLAKPPAAAKLAGCNATPYTIQNGVTTSCSKCAGVTAKANCNCPRGTCECNIPASSPPQTVTCTNGGTLQLSLCQ